jgi:hypothetical protein
MIALGAASKFNYLTLKYFLQAAFILAFAISTPSLAIGAEKKLSLKDLTKEFERLMGVKKYDPDEDDRKFKKKLTIRDVRGLDGIFSNAGQNFGLYSYCFEDSGKGGNRVKYQEEHLFSLLEKTGMDYQVYRDIKKVYDEKYKIGHNHPRRVIILEKRSDWNQLMSVCTEADRKTGMKDSVENKTFVKKVEEILVVK